MANRGRNSPFLLVQEYKILRFEGVFVFDICLNTY